MRPRTVGLGRYVVLLLEGQAVVSWCSELGSTRPGHLMSVHHGSCRGSERGLGTGILLVASEQAAPASVYSIGLFLPWLGRKLDDGNRTHTIWYIVHPVVGSYPLLELCTAER